MKGKCEVCGKITDLSKSDFDLLNKKICWDCIEEVEK
jgi:hypothetical protein